MTDGNDKIERGSVMLDFFTTPQALEILKSIAEGVIAVGGVIIVCLLVSYFFGELR